MALRTFDSIEISMMSKKVGGDGKSNEAPPIAISLQTS